MPDRQGKSLLCQQWDKKREKFKLLDWSCWSNSCRLLVCETGQREERTVKSGVCSPAGPSRLLTPRWSSLYSSGGSPEWKQLAFPAVSFPPGPFYPSANFTHQFPGVQCSQSQLNWPVSTLSAFPLRSVSYFSCPELASDSESTILIQVAV